MELFDEDGDGFVSVAEAHQVLEPVLGYSLEQTKKLFKAADRNNDGRLNKDEFIDFFFKMRDMWVTGLYPGSKSLWARLSGENKGVEENGMGVGFRWVFGLLGFVQRTCECRSHRPTPRSKFCHVSKGKSVVCVLSMISTLTKMQTSGTVGKGRGGRAQKWPQGQQKELLCHKICGGPSGLSFLGWARLKGAMYIVHVVVRDVPPYKRDLTTWWVLGCHVTVSLDGRARPLRRRSVHVLSVLASESETWRISSKNSTLTEAGTSPWTRQRAPWKTWCWQMNR